MKTIFLDFGNVIGFFDHSRAIRQLEVFTEIPATDLDKMLYGGQLCDDFESGRITTAQYVFEAKRIAKIQCSDEQFLAAYTDIFWPNPVVCELIPKLAQKYRLVLASNTNEAHYNRFHPMFARELAHFQYLVTSHEVQARKPRIEFYTRAQEFAEADPHECVFVDDLPRNIVAAEQHGWKGVLYSREDDLPKKLRAVGIQISDEIR
jgi:glucose-1-phosphatase